MLAPIVNNPYGEPVKDPAVFAVARQPPTWKLKTEPDKVGVMFWLDRREPAASPFEKVFIVGQAVDDPAAFSNSLVKAAIDAFIRHAGLPIWLAFGAERKLIHPDGAFQDAILNPTTTPWQSLVPAALAWRKNYGLD